jgi:hypothetical protein
MFLVGDLQEVPVFDDNNLNHAKMTRIFTISVREQSERVGLVMMSDGVNEMLCNCTPTTPYSYFRQMFLRRAMSGVVLFASVSACTRA